ncbi:Mitochondrial coenzyme A transporter SLC25A42 [Nymphon striatum]|nr:Mitochondrial coenzyme A transporter SLC25A42 [Nymphon striatum]
MIHDKDCWQSIICNTSNFQSNCWTGTCETCKGGTLLETKLSGEIDMAKATEWLHWETDENQVLKKLTKSGCYGELLDLVLQSLPQAQGHTRVKRIQSNAFESLKEANRILQIDFAMAYSCKYQGRNSTKEKDTVYTFINRLYEHIVKDVPASDEVGDIIFSDGPSSEFKNRFCMKILYDLAQKFQKDFSWKYFATSHGKGVVDGVGGRAKSLVRQKSMSKDVSHAVQSSKDFADLASELMSATTVLHISQEEMNEAVALTDSWEDAPAADGIRSMHDAQCIFKDHKIELRHVTGQTESDVVIHYEAQSQLPDDIVTAHVPGDVVAGDWVAVIYDDQWWPGTVDSVSTDDEITVSSMKPVAKNKFIWRQDSNGKCIDTDVVPTTEVLAKLKEIPVPLQVENFHSKKAIRFMIESCKNHGIRSLWRGNTATIVRIAPYSAIQFTAHDYFKTVLHVNSKGKRYKSLYKVVKGQSLHSLYRGYVPTIIGVIPYAAISFYTYESLKAHYCDKTNNSHLHPLVRLCFGAVAGLLGQASSYPMDIVRRRMQTDVIIGNHYESIRHTLKSVVKNEGFIGGLYKGLSLNMIKGPIAAGISFMTNDLIRQLQIF